MKKNITILYVEDDVIRREELMLLLSGIYSEVFEASNGQEGLALYKEHSPDMVITDIEMPLMNGLLMIEKIRKLNTKVPILITTDYETREYYSILIKYNNIDFLVKETITNITLKNSLDTLEKYLDKDIRVTLEELSKGVFFDVLNQTLIINGENEPLTHKESQLLQLFCKKNNQVVTYETINQVIWDWKVLSIFSVRSLVRSLRKKLPQEYIINIKEVGYKFTKK